MTRLYRYLRTLLATACVWAATAAPLFAQKAGPKVPTEKSYMLPYTLVILLIGLSLMLVLRPVGRPTEGRAKKEA
jgi:hypothetical protein